MNERKKIAFVASECQPFFTSGGLGEVIGSLPKALVSNKLFDLTVYLPLYSTISKQYHNKLIYCANITVNLAWRRQYCGIYKYMQNGVNYIFIDNEYYFKREKLYGYYDDAERFAFFSKAVIDVIKYQNIAYDIIHCHDWQTGLLSVYLRTIYYNEDLFKNTKRIFTIHNIEYQGKYDINSNILTDVFGLHPNDAYLLEYRGTINIMKGAMEASNIVSTVSPSYAEEIQTMEYAHGLEDEVLRCKEEHKLCGILNGIDTTFYNPDTDKALFKTYNVNNIDAKAINKKELLNMLNLVDDGTILVGMVTRLVKHKGLEILKNAFAEMINLPFKLVILGTGDAAYEGYFKDMENKYPNKVKVILAFNQDLARKIYAAADIFLMPSESEPCGLSQMIASRYGTIPMVRKTGGLKDSIIDFSRKNGNGYCFDGFEASSLLSTFKRALKDYDSDKWHTYQTLVMEKDFSWNKSAQNYCEMYKKLI